FQMPRRTGPSATMSVTSTGEIVGLPEDTRLVEIKPEMVQPKEEPIEIKQEEPDEVHQLIKYDSRIPTNEVKTEESYDPSANDLNMPSTSDSANSFPVYSDDLDHHIHRVLIRSKRFLYSEATARGVRLVLTTGMSIQKAADAVGVSHSCIFQNVRLTREHPECPPEYKKRPSHQDGKEVSVPASRSMYVPVKNCGPASRAEIHTVIREVLLEFVDDSIRPKMFNAVANVVAEHTTVRDACVMNDLHPSQVLPYISKTRVALGPRCPVPPNVSAVRMFPLKSVAKRQTTKEITEAQRQSSSSAATKMPTSKWRDRLKQQGSGPVSVYAIGPESSPKTVTIDGVVFPTSCNELSFVINHALMDSSKARPFIGTREQLREKLTSILSKLRSIRSVPDMVNKLHLIIIENWAMKRIIDLDSPNFIISIPCRKDLWLISRVIDLSNITIVKEENSNVPGRC
ncbi:hypothetical protein PFISCL1PPCAC_9918, partial [Pristionchus fissidentatus]